MEGGDTQLGLGRGWTQPCTPGSQQSGQPLSLWPSVPLVRAAWMSALSPFSWTLPGLRASARLHGVAGPTGTGVRLVITVGWPHQPHITGQ